MDEQQFCQTAQQKRNSARNKRAPHTERDGESERGIRTITEKTRTCIHDRTYLDNDVTKDTKNLVAEGHTPTFLWAEAASYTAYTVNSIPVTPYESWHRRRPYVSNLSFFGSIAYAHVPKEERRKLDKKSSRRIFVFYKTTSKAWKGGIQKAEP
jgi:hypothetical protein